MSPLLSIMSLLGHDWSLLCNFCTSWHCSMARINSEQGDYEQINKYDAKNWGKSHLIWYKYMITIVLRWHCCNVELFCFTINHINNSDIFLTVLLFYKTRGYILIAWFIFSLLPAAPSRLRKMMRLLTRRGCWLPKWSRVTSHTS